MSGRTILEVKGLQKNYGDKRILDGLDLSIQQGDIYGFLGPNGSGKTTTIRCILGLVHYQAGSISLNGYDIKKDFKNAIRKVGSVVETPKFYENYSGYQNLKMMAALYGDIPEKRIREVLDIVSMSNRAKDKVKNYSLGMKQRLGIARALIHSPEFVILDEPTNGLDPQGMKEIREMISQLAIEQNITFFISSHLLHEVEILCNRVGILKTGVKLAEGNVKTLLRQDNEVLEIHTDSRDKAKAKLEGIKYVRAVNDFEKGIQVEIDKGFSNKLINILIESNIPVNYVIPKNQSLENYFIELTKGGEHIA